MKPNLAEGSCSSIVAKLQSRVDSLREMQQQHVPSASLCPYMNWNVSGLGSGPKTYCPLAGKMTG